MRRSFVLLSALLFVSCDQPPTRELAAAETALTQAREAEADKYAPSRFKDAEAALSQAKREVEEKDYRAALSSANDATDKARAAAKAAATAKTMARSAAELTLAEIQAAIDQAQAERDAASRLPPGALADADQQLEAVKQQVAALRTSIEAGEVLEAQKLAGGAKPRAAALAQVYTDARTRWEAEHPAKKGKPARKK